MAVPTQNITAPGIGDDYQIRTDTRAMTVATAMFFMIGLLTCLNDVIIPHLKSIFDLSYARAMLVQFSFFSSYFLFSFPGAILVEKLGYKRTMVSGLMLMACGAIGFLPAARFALFPIFLAALIVLAAGMTIAQVAVNPYVTVVGPARTASSRLNLAQAFNSIGTVLAPLAGGFLILRAVAPETPEHVRSMTEMARQTYRAAEASTVRLPYIGAALLLLLLALIVGLMRLRTTGETSEMTQDFRPGAFAEALSRPQSLSGHPWLWFAALGIFTYVGAEVSIGSLLVNYMGLPEIAGLRERAAALYLMVYWGGAMIGRFLGSAVLRRVRTGPVLGAAAIAAFALVVTSILTHGPTAMFAMLLVGLCNSIMFPSIFTLGLQDLGPLTSKGSGVLVAAIVGGAILPLATGRLADHIGLHHSFIIPAVCYVYIAAFGFAAIRRRNAYDGLIPAEPI